MRRPAWALITLLAASCAGEAPPTPEAPTSTPTTSRDEPADEPPAPAPAPRPEETVGADDYQLTHRDCRALAAAYGGAWLADELATLSAKKLERESHDEAAAELESGAAEMRDNWLNECEKTVGTPYRHENLACAMKAKTMKTFDDCWYGRAP